MTKSYTTLYELITKYMKKYSCKNYYECLYKAINENKPKVIELHPQDYVKIFGNFKGMQLSDVALYSITPINESIKIAELISQIYKDKNKNLSLLETSACVGGNTLGFIYKNITKIIAIEYAKNNFEILKHNLFETNYKQVDSVKNLFENIDKSLLLVHNDCVDFMSKIKNIDIDIIFMDPPWSGIELVKKKINDVKYGEISITNLFNLDNVKKSDLILLKLPNNDLTSNFISFIPSNFKLKTIGIKKRKNMFNSYYIHIFYNSNKFPNLNFLKEEILVDYFNIYLIRFRYVSKKSRTRKGSRRKSSKKKSKTRKGSRRK